MEEEGDEDDRLDALEEVGEKDAPQGGQTLLLPPPFSPACSFPSSLLSLASYGSS